MKNKTLTNKQSQFCIEYIKDYNSSAAAVRAGYSKKGANVSGPRLLSNVSIANKIKELQNKEGQKHHITKALLLDELMDIIKDMRTGSNKRKANSARVAISSIQTINTMLGFNEEEVSQEKVIVALQVNVKTTNKDGKGENIEI